MRRFLVSPLMGFVDFLYGSNLRKLNLGSLAVLVVTHRRGIRNRRTGRGLILQEYFTDGLLLLGLPLFVLLLLGFRSEPVKESIAVAMVPVDLENGLVNIDEYSSDPLSHDLLLLLFNLFVPFLLVAFGGLGRRSLVVRPVL